MSSLFDIHMMRLTILDLRFRRLFRRGHIAMLVSCVFMLGFYRDRAGFLVGPASLAARPHSEATEAALEPELVCV